MTDTPTRADLKRYRENRQDEIDGAYLYRALAAAEADPDLATVYGRLAEVEERHAEFWGRRLAQAGHPAGPPEPSWRARGLALIARRFGPALVTQVMAATETANRTMYDEQPEAADTTMAADERSHARVLSAMSVPAAEEGLGGPAVARLEGRHRGLTSGNALRAAVLGANDGLVSNLSLVMGVAGAAVADQTIVVTGMAGLLAGAASMALGEWISVQSSREAAERQLAIERDEIAAVPDEEREELTLIYQARGLPEDEARIVAERVFEQGEEAALDVMAREELGIDPDELGGSPWTAAWASFLLFAIGAIVPVLPFLVASGTAAVVGAAVASGAALFLLGAAITLFTGRGTARSGLRQLGFGLAAAAITYGGGALLGTVLG